MVGQEVFQSGIIPSDTDFRIYRDFGNIPGSAELAAILALFTFPPALNDHVLTRPAGIDLAFIENGFIYHTKYDTADRILTDSIQRAGRSQIDPSPLPTLHARVMDIVVS